MQYYSILPPEARLQLLIEADYFTIKELCQEPIFKTICNSDILWKEKIKREFGKDFNVDLEPESSKNKYLKLLRAKLRKDRDKTVKEREENVFEKGFDQLQKIGENDIIEDETFGKRHNDLTAKIKKLEDEIGKLNLDIKGGNVLYFKTNENMSYIEHYFERFGVSSIKQIHDLEFGKIYKVVLYGTGFSEKVRKLNDYQYLDER
jgi:hypothetical protein